MYALLIMLTLKDIFFMMQIPLSNSQASSGNKKKQYDFKPKIILLGTDYTGKTSILRRYVDNSFSSNVLATVSSLYLIKLLYVHIAYLHVQCMLLRN